LTKTFSDPDGSTHQVLKDVSCEIEKGEVISIIGPSGTGKSTFLRALNMMDPPTSGEIILDGENILAKGYPLNKLRQKVGMLFQSFNLFEHLNVLDNVTKVPLLLRDITKLADKRDVIEQISTEMLTNVLYDYRPMTVRLTYGELKDITAVDFMIKDLTSSPFQAEGFDPKVLEPIKALAKEIIEEPTKLGYRVKVVV